MNLIAAAALAMLAGGDTAMLFTIRDGRKLGFIDRTGKVVVAPKYDAVGEFSDGMARITEGQKNGYIDATGKVVIAPQYDTADEFDGDRAIVRQGDKYKLIDRQGKIVAEIPHRVLGRFHAGLCRMQRPRSTDANGKSIPTAYGYFDRDGKVVIAPQFINAGEFPDDGVGLTIVIKDHEYLYIDRTGKPIIRVSIEGKDRADGFMEGLLRWKEDGYWGYRDTKGEWAIKPQYDSADHFENGLARVTLKNKTLYIDRQGHPVDPPRFHQLKPFSEGLAPASDQGRYCYINEKRELAVELPVVQEAHGFSNGRARVRLDGKFGYIDNTGKWAIKPRFSSAYDFKGGLAQVMFEDGTFGYIDPAGTQIWRSSR